MIRRLGGWFALAWRYWRDPKFDGVSVSAELLWIRAIAYCSEQRTDGRFGRDVLRGLTPRLTVSGRRCAAELVRAGLLIETPSGYEIPAFLKWQPSAAERAEQLERDAARKREARASARTSQRTSAGTDAGRPPGVPIQRVGVGVGVERSSTTPTPRGRRRFAERDDGPMPEVEWIEMVDDDGNEVVHRVVNGRVVQ